MCDDCIAPVLGHDRATVEPSYASVRLWDDAAAALGADAAALARASDRAPKRRMPMRPASGELLLRRVFVLEAADGAPSIERLRGAEAVMAVAPHMHRLDPDDRARQAAELDFLARLAAQVPIARLRFRRGYDELAAVRAAVARDLARGGVNQPLRDELGEQRRDVTRGARWVDVELRDDTRADLVDARACLDVFEHDGADRVQPEIRA